MRILAIFGVLCAGPAFADCQDELGLGRAGLRASEFRIAEPGVVSECGGRCRLSGLIIPQSKTLKLEVSSMSWVADGFETVLIGAPEGLLLDLLVEDARLVPLTTDPWMKYYLDLQNRRNLINIETMIAWSPEMDALEVEKNQLNLSGENGSHLSSRVASATADMLPGRISEFGALAPEAVSLTVENAGYLDRLALGWMLAQLSSMPGVPITGVAAALNEFQDILADWPGDVFPPDSKANLTKRIAAGPFPWGRFDLAMAEGEIAFAFDRLVN